ncbi:MAG TPA: YggS family pyridoxal phosphate-dependent enzyme [Nitriliruptoraceae bacterium]|nr:YggS family pyridoxal phosphate-dependent enzyme [Nitriliruptoraceae bacterium]
MGADDHGRGRCPRRFRRRQPRRGQGRSARRRSGRRRSRQHRGTTRSSHGDVAARLSAVRERLEAAGAAGGRTDDVRLVAVSKTHPWSALVAAANAGVTDIGENRVAELVAKMDHVDRDDALARMRWHFIGRLQSRKATHLVGRDVLVHSVDRRSLVDRLQRLADAASTMQALLVQVNVADDPSKAGCSLQEVDDLVAYACGQPNLEVAGLMTMPPLPEPSAQASSTATAEFARPYFAQLRRLRDRLQAEWPTVRELSMGMSADLEAAVTEGATIVRVGTGVFGPRGNGPWLGEQNEEAVR